MTPLTYIFQEDPMAPVADASPKEKVGRHRSVTRHSTDCAQCSDILVPSTVMKLLLSAILALATGVSAAPKIVGGPFVVNLTAKSATVVWVVQSSELVLRPASGVEGRISPTFQIEKTTL